MMRTTACAPFIGLSLLAACSVLAACAESDDGDGGQAQCITGQTVGCPCADGSTGTAACSALGAPGACMCGGSMAGTGGGGAGGVGGLGGIGGLGGMAGTTGGAAGMMMGGVGGVGGVVGGSSGGGVGGMTGGTMAGMGGVSGAAGGGTGGVPDGATCAAAAEWDPAWTEFEDEVLRLTNEARAAGHNCDAEGMFGAADPLTMSPILRCSSRLHSKDMGEAGYFDHTAPDGRDPFERMADAGYMGFTMGENIAKGQQTPEEVVNGWLDSDGHCANMMNENFTEIGVGFWEGEPESMFFNGNKLWTQNFGAPRDGGGDGTCPFPPQFCD